MNSLIFSAPMVRALIAGTKTQTRRVLKPQIVRYSPFTVGQRIWVRETWHPGFDAGPIYRATDGEPPPHCRDGWRWRSPIHMPRWASRITLRITDVRVQRAQEISEEDARAEGVFGYLYAIPGQPGEWLRYRKAFAELWDSINAKRGYGWSENPWCWALTFDVLRQNVDEVGM